MKKAVFRESSSQIEILKEFSRLSSEPSSNKDIDSLRMQRINKFKEEGYKNLSEVFGNKHNAYLDKFTAPIIASKPSIVDIQSLETKEILGLKVIGRISIDEKKIEKWIDSEIAIKGVVFTDLIDAVNNHPKRVKRFFQIERYKKSKPISDLVVALNQFGSFLDIPDNLNLEGIFVLEICITQANVIFPIHMISNIGKSSSANLLIKITSKNGSDDHSILMIRNENTLDENASLCVYQDQDTKLGVAVFADEQIEVGKNATINTFLVDKGSRLTDRFLYVDLAGEGGDATITGVYKPGIGQRFYYDTQQNHNASHTTSDLLYKGVLERESYAWWKGNILVAKDTVGTNGYQANNNLLLEQSAKVESIPGLEIITDDVRCSHGVTMGNIDKNQMFYLQSRGINKNDAEKLIVEGFLQSTIRRVANDQLRNVIAVSV